MELYGIDAVCSDSEGVRSESHVENWTCGHPRLDGNHEMKRENRIPSIVSTRRVLEHWLQFLVFHFPVSINVNDRLIPFRRMQWQEK